jgi:hypothetical protein
MIPKRGWRLSAQRPPFRFLPSSSRPIAIAAWQIILLSTTPAQVFLLRPPLASGTGWNLPRRAASTVPVCPNRSVSKKEKKITKENKQSKESTKGVFTSLYTLTCQKPRRVPWCTQNDTCLAKSSLGRCPTSRPVGEFGSVGGGNWSVGDRPNLNLSSGSMSKPLGPSA